MSDKPDGRSHGTHVHNTMIVATAAILIVAAVMLVLVFGSRPASSAREHFSVAQVVEYIRAGRISGSAISTVGESNDVWVYDRETTRWVRVDGTYNDLMSAITTCGTPCANVHQVLN